MAALLVDVGASALAFALVASVYAMVIGILAAQGRSEALLVSATRGVRTAVGLVMLSCAGLWVAFLTNRFDLEYVFMYSSRELPLPYKLAALWGGQKGSLMLWSLILSIYSLVVVRPRRSPDPVLVAGVGATMMAILSFFLTLANFSTNPFERLAEGAAPDGRGLNPLLQHPAMAIHPPTLYTGFVGMSVPFAFMLSSLLLGRTDDRWIRLSRRVTLVAFTALFIGNMLGMAWAYMELGWGGYWAWDPVENAACMPLLTGTALLHSVMIQEKRGMLKIWNASLAAITFLLTILGTFLTRSGVVSSVHSFGASTLGSYFLAFLAFATFGTTGVIVARRKLLRSEHSLDSIWSRESAFIVNNLIFVGAAFSILWGTLYPILSEAVTNVKATVGAPFFNRVNVPIAVFQLFLIGVGPLIAWRRASLAQLRRSFLMPLSVAGLVGAALFGLGVRKTWALLVFALSLFVLATIVIELYRGTRARMQNGEAPVQALLLLVLRNPRRYGGYVVHLGVLLFFCGIAASSAYQKEGEALLTEGGELTVGSYRLKLMKVEDADIKRASGIVTTVDAYRTTRGHEEKVATLRPERLTYYTGIREEEQPTTNVAIRSNWRDDLYVLPAAFFPDKRQVHLRAYVNPMVSWIWAGGAVVLLGIVITLLPAFGPGARSRGLPVMGAARSTVPAAVVAPAVNTGERA
ncbi:MAG: heme lyase CcmF/NrfE family subunit [Acidobacteriota bacterium]